LKYNFNRKNREKEKEVEIKRYQSRIDGESKRGKEKKRGE